MRSDKNDCENDTCVSKYCKKFVLAVKETPCGMLWDTVILLYFKSSWKYKFWLKIYSLMIIKSDSWNLPINVKMLKLITLPLRRVILVALIELQIIRYVYIYIYIFIYTHIQLKDNYVILLDVIQRINYMFRPLCLANIRVVLSL